MNTHRFRLPVAAGALLLFVLSFQARAQTPIPSWESDTSFAIGATAADNQLKYLRDSIHIDFVPTYRVETPSSTWMNPDSLAGLATDSGTAVAP